MSQESERSNNHTEEYAMSQKLLEIERKAVRLPVKEREALAERLIQSLDDPPLTQA